MALILLAEDNPVTAEIMRVRLESAGHEVLWAADGREALDRLASVRPQLILLDMMLPEVDGPEILRVLKQDAVLASIPVVVVSARSQEEDILGALAAGADDYVTKPISLRELVARSERVLAQGPPPLRIAVQGDDGAVRVAEVTDANPGTASLRFHRDSSPRLALGDRAKLSLSSPSLPETIELEGEVRARTEAEPHRIYVFALDRRGDRASEMTQAFLNLVGSRVDYRVRLDDAPVEAQVLLQADGDSHSFSGSLQDVSTSGARIVLKLDAERQLRLVESFEMRFVLPGDDEAFTLTVNVRHRSMTGDGVAYGIRFDAERSPEFEQQQERISAFVLAHRE